MPLVIPQQQPAMGMPVQMIGASTPPPQTYGPPQGIMGQNQAMGPLIAALMKQRALKRAAGVPVPGAAVSNGLSMAQAQANPWTGMAGAGNAPTLSTT